MEREQAGDAREQSRFELLKQNEELRSLLDRVMNAKEEWEKTADCLNVLVILTGEEGKIKRCNRPLRDFAGRPYAQLLGRDWRELLTECGMQKIPPDGEKGETFHPPSQRWFIMNFYPFKGMARGEREVSGTVITLHDTTELKISQLKILQQEKLASIGQVAAGVAHEINNPVGFISSNLGTLHKYIEKLMKYVLLLTETLNSLKDPQVAEAMREARSKLKFDFIVKDINTLIAESLDGVDRVRTIVQNLKSFSHMNQKETQYADINKCMDATINIVWNELKYKATLKKEYGDLPLIKCFPQQLNQVFMNLLVNAAHAIEKQGEVAIKTWEQEGSVFVSVADTGCGIPEENREKIFEPFFTTKEVGKGTGLGLSIAFDIVKKHNGEIMVQSEAGKGTIFTVRVPVAERQQ
jgi:two-component system NtrC family sensor kinase